MPILPLPFLPPLLLSGSITEPSKRFGFEAVTKKIANVVICSQSRAGKFYLRTPWRLRAGDSGRSDTDRPFGLFHRIRSQGRERLLAHPEQIRRVASVGVLQVCVRTLRPVQFTPSAG